MRFTLTAKMHEIQSVDSQENQLQSLPPDVIFQDKKCTKFDF